MNSLHASSFPNLLPLSDANHENNSTFVGVASSVRLLFKFIQDYNNALIEDDGKKPQLINGMLTILDDVRSQIIKFQPPPVSQKRAELRRCNTELRRGAPPHKDKKPLDPLVEQNQKLQHHLASCLAERKSLEKMFSSLGKEKEIIATELQKKVRELNAMEEVLSELKAENEMLSEKVKHCINEHKGNKNAKVLGLGIESQGNALLQERNKALSNQLQKSLDGYRTMKRRLKDAHEEKSAMESQIVEAKEGLGLSVKVVHGLREKINEGKVEKVGVEDLEVMLNSVEKMLFELLIRFSNDDDLKKRRDNVGGEKRLEM